MNDTTVWCQSLSGTEPQRERRRPAKAKNFRAHHRRPNGRRQAATRLQAISSPLRKITKSIVGATIGRPSLFAIIDRFREPQGTPLPILHNSALQQTVPPKNALRIAKRKNNASRGAGSQQKRKCRCGKIHAHSRGNRQKTPYRRQHQSTNRRSSFPFEIAFPTPSRRTGWRNIPHTTRFIRPHNARDIPLLWRGSFFHNAVCSLMMRFALLWHGLFTLPLGRGLAKYHAIPRGLLTLPLQGRG